MRAMQEIRVHIDGMREVFELLRLIHADQHQIKKEIHAMSAALDRLTSEVTETSTAVDSVLALVEGLAQQIRDAATDPAALNALADELDAKQQAIAAAVAANTPAA